MTAPTAVPPAPPARARASLGTRRRVAIAVAVIAAAVGLVLYKGLADATTYFYTADQAVAHRSEQGTRTFRIEGTVVAGTVHTAGTAVDFDIADNGVTVHVVHTGGQPELFKPNIPVVLEGHWSGDHFASDLIMVKHSASYRQQNPGRVKDYTQ